MACNYGLREVRYGLLHSRVACEFGLPGFEGSAVRLEPFLQEWLFGEELFKNACLASPVVIWSLGKGSLARDPYQGQ